MGTDREATSLHIGRHLSLVDRNGWEYVTRLASRSAVGIVALTGDGKVLVVEQHRPPAGRSVLELPAGLVGDVPGAEEEAFVEAARRELLEETGYVAERWTELVHCYSSPGLSDESIVLFLAQGLEKQGTGGGDGDEQIVVHEVPIDDVPGWLQRQEAQADLKLLAGLYLAQNLLESEVQDR